MLSSAASLAALSIASTAYADVIDDLAPGAWVELPGTAMSAVEPDPTPPGDSRAVVSAWSGAAYDTARERVIVWGGGHTDYSGNEVYAFSMTTLTWSRIVEPSSDIPTGVDNYETYGDGQPGSRHTYSGLEYVPPPVDAMFALGGSRWQNGGGSGAVWRLDLATNTWSRETDYPGSVFFGSPTVFDPVTGHLFHRGVTILGEYDPNGDSWEEAFENGAGWYEANVSTALDPERRLMLIIGDGTFNAFHVDDHTFESVASTGGDAIIGAGAPGFQFDPMSKMFVAWNGGADVYTLDPATWEWLVHPTTGTPPGPPQESGGTFGRFRYVPSRNVYVLVNAYDQNVFLFRLSPGDGVPPPDPATTSSSTATSASASSNASAGHGAGNGATSGGLTGGGGSGGAGADDDGDDTGCSVTVSRGAATSWVAVAGVLLVIGAARRRATVIRRRDARSSVARAPLLGRGLQLHRR